jgi:hypothetical protein
MHMHIVIAIQQQQQQQQSYHSYHGTKRGCKESFPQESVEKEAFSDASNDTFVHQLWLPINGMFGVFSHALCAHNGVYLAHAVGADTTS